MKLNAGKIVFLTGAILVYANCAKPDKKSVCNLKDQRCDSAKISLGNLTKDTIIYNWSFSGLQDTLLPNETDHIYAGRVEVTFDQKTCEKQSKATSVLTVQSNRGDWAIVVDNCDKKANFRYDLTDPKNGLIFLYNDTGQ